MKSNILLFYLLTQAAFLGAQLPANPFSPSSSWSEGHGTYAQQNTFVSSLTEFDSIIVDTISLPEGFTGFFPTGTITTPIKASSNTYNYWGTNGKAIYKVVCSQDSTDVITALASNLGGNNFVSGYWLMDANEYGYFLSNYKLLVLKDNPSDPLSDITVDTTLDLSTYQVQGVNDDLWAIKLLYTGELVITSSRGNIFIVNRNTLEVLDHVLLGGDTLINSLVIDELNHIYINTKQELIKFRWDNGTLSEIWNLNLGESGSTPTLVGSSQSPPEEQFIAVTDKSNVMNLVLVFRDEIPSDWQGIPNYPLRVAAVAPIDFNVQFPAFNIRPTQNSILVEGHSFLLVRWDNLFPTANAYKPGMEKWTWDTNSRQLTQDWVNEEIYIPNSMQGLSSSTGYFYAIGQSLNPQGEKLWSFKGMDWESGEERISIDLAPHSDSRFNTKGSGIQIGPFQDVITMSPDMILRFRKFNMLTNTQDIDTERKIKLFPNPTNGILNIAIDNEVFDIEIYDLLGKRKFTQSGIRSFYQMNMDGFKSGGYLLKLRIPSTGEIISQKLIKI